MSALPKFNRKAAVVTGAQQGIGAAIAIRLARAGMDVAINWLDDRQAAEGVADAVRAHGVEALLVQADICSVDGVTGMIGEAGDRFGRLDVLVNNAAIFPRSPFLEMDAATWDAVLNVNLRGTVFASQAAAKVMIEGRSGGVIINTSSQAVRGVLHSAHYVASKGAIISLTRALALELAPHAIRVNAVSPGLIDTAQPRIVHTDEELAERGRQVPLGRIGQPDDIAGTVAFLASDDASYITGQTIPINGGTYLP